MVLEQNVFENNIIKFDNVQSLKRNIKKVLSLFS